MPSLHTISPGMFTTVQDLGRPSQTALAICDGGAADPLSLRLANRLVQNPDSAAALEFTLIGGTFLFPSRATIAITGALCSPTISSPTQPPRPTPHSQPIHIQSGEQLAIGPLHAGARAYLSVRGGIDVPEVLGSRSTHIAAKFGGFQGRPLNAGDIIPIGTAPPSPPAPTANWPTYSINSHTIRAIPGAHQHLFDDQATQAFWNSAFTISNQSSRTGIRLTGPTISSLVSGQLQSEPMPWGAVQIPANGQPIILGVDHPTTGGYPVIAAVGAIDLHILGQARPGDTLRFSPVTQTQALAHFRERELLLNHI